ncbi:MAG: YggS family pyridoxal phosphate-dependent enzyme [Candidatus Omnitrophota bacterium]
MIKDNILRIKERISFVCSKIGRDPESIIIIAAAKARPLNQIQDAVAAGVSDIGENRVQEAVVKYNNLSPAAYCLRPIHWHMIGHLQSNKVKEAVRIFDLIQSVDSLHLAEGINKEAQKINKIQDILVEVNTSGESSKFGLNPQEAFETIKQILEFKNISVKGLMTIAPIADNPDKARPYFKKLRNLMEEINVRQNTQGAIRILSMGMSDDFEAAIEEGANMVRLGRAIFEN